MGYENIKPTMIQTTELPSHGTVYGGKIPKEFTIRPMTVNELKIIYGSSNINNALNDIIKEVVIGVKDFPVDDLISADKLFIAYKLRAITFGENYSVKVTCPHCNESVDLNINLNTDIEVKYLPDDFENPYDIGMLPISGDELKLKMLNTKDLEKVFSRCKEIKKQFADYKGEPLFPITLANQIYSINGKKPLSRELEEYVLNLPAIDYSYITSWAEKTNCGIQMPIDVDCPNCGKAISIEVRLGEEFFRPSFTF